MEHSAPMPEQQPEKRPPWRPSSYKPEYCERVIELGKQGYSVVEMACDVGVSRNTIEQAWPARYPDFLKAFEQARAESQAWWEEQGRKNLTSKTFQQALYSRSMAARFPHDWRESKEQRLAGHDGGPIGVQMNRKPEVSVHELLRALQKAKMGGAEPEPPDDGRDLL